jgi:glycosyltransferase involved in cell wall biosynthesis
LSPAHLSGDPLDPETALRWGLSLTADPGTVLHAHNYEIALPALIAQGLMGAPLVVTLHLPAPERYRALERQLLSAADAVIAVSRSLAGEYAEYGCRVIPNGVDTRFYHPDPGTRREAGRLLFAGRLSPQKGCDLALHAFRELLPTFPELRLHVAGAGPWEQAYRNLARSLGLGDRVRWLGWLEPAALREEYRRCRAFLMPSRFEPFGLSALEALACGAPVVAANVGGLPEFITDQETGVLVSPADPSALAQTARALLVSPSHADRLGAAAAIRAQELTWDRAAAETLRVYQSLPQNPPPPPLSPEERRRRANEILRAALNPEPVHP